MESRAKKIKFTKVKEAKVLAIICMIAVSCTVGVVCIRGYHHCRKEVADKFCIPMLQWESLVNRDQTLRQAVAQEYDSIHEGYMLPSVVPNPLESL